MNTHQRINGFKQISAFYSWVFDNLHTVKQSHISLYMFILNQCNRSMWAEWIKIPFDIGMNGSAIGNRKTYYDCIKDLVDFGLIKKIDGQNQYKAMAVKLVMLYDSDTSTDTSTDTSCGISSEQALILPHIQAPYTYIKLLTDNIQQITDNIESVLEFLNSGKKKSKPAEKKFNFSKSIIDYGADADLVRDWLIVRNNKDASNTETAFKLFITQVEKSKRNINDVLKKCIEKSWKGFDASWEFGDGKLQSDKDIFIQDDDIDKYIKMIDSLSITDWQREMKKFVINTEAKMLFCPNLKRFVPWKMIESCQRLYDHAKVEFASKALGDTYMTPATYGRVR